ncbi:hypothetical protein [Halostella sp. PRR32]|uniref:DUF7553 family protein n=1 Tax=Halostella sp. PRR32 TaxID=3098147 RepID=UPI00110DC426|nr:hypothetical protein [Halostella sp. PRR32]
MSRDELERVSELLRDASAAADDDEARERLYDQSDQFADLATADRGPDHGRLARHERILDEIGDDENDEVRTAIDDALAEIRSYRETLEGV